ncbi:MAG: hypothetical protein IJM08_08200 [Firmicutes bacterium]|nr:hypothetical protein [Bacillota bacterium]
MTSYIGKKLDFLMNLTSTKNNMLARALNFDNSHISRIRSGERGLPKQRSFLEPAAEFFAKRIKEPFQIKGAEDMICPGRKWPESVSDQAALIAAWISDSDLGYYYPGSADMMHGATGEDAFGSMQSPSFFYYGNEGKRQAAERLLTAAFTSQAAERLLLYSDEDMSWLTEDPSYFRKWAGLMMSNLQKGNRICMIHNLSRNLGELMAAVSGWIPLYLTGGIEPWYCPKLRDGLFHQTRFIIQSREAAFGGYTGNDVKSAYTVYTGDREMLQLLEAQFQALLAISQPLMQVFTRTDSLAFEEAAGEFLKAEGEMLCAVQQSQEVHFYVKNSNALILSPQNPGILLSVKDPNLLSALKEFALRAPASGSAQELEGYLR